MGNGELFMKRLLTSLLLAGAVAGGATGISDEQTVPTGPYLGQTAPGDTPVAFAPGLVSSPHWDYGIGIGEGAKEFYFVTAGGMYEKATFLSYKQVGDQWQKTVISKHVGQPVIAPNGKMMHLGRRYKERTKDGWSEVKTLDLPFNDGYIMRMSSSNKGTLYFDSYVKDQPNFPIRYARKVGGKYQMPQALSENINQGKNVNHPFVAPDESYIIWDAVREGGHGSSDIYISFKQKDGTWGRAMSLGDKINTSAWEAAATVSPDGKYIFFNRNIGSDKYENVDIMWVSASIIDELRTKQ